jgi:hypothetical protein
MWPRWSPCTMNQWPTAALNVVRALVRTRPDMAHSCAQQTTTEPTRTVCNPTVKIMPFRAQCDKRCKHVVYMESILSYHAHGAHSNHPIGRLYVHATPSHRNIPHTHRFEATCIADVGVKVRMQSAYVVPCACVCLCVCVCLTITTARKSRDPLGRRC